MPATTIGRRSGAAAMGLAFIVFAAPAPAQDSGYPSHPVRMLAASAAGGNPDVLARLLARHTGDVETALLAYPVERKPRTDWVTLKSREQFANNRKDSPPPFVDRTWLFVNDVVNGQEALQPV